MLTEGIAEEKALMRQNIENTNEKKEREQPKH